MNKAELITKIKAGSQSILDEMVHDCKSKEASSINNEGIESQVNYLLQSGIRLEEIENAHNN